MEHNEQSETRTAAPAPSAEPACPVASVTAWPAKSPKWIWERQPGESVAAYRAFCIYRDLGPNRSLRQAWQATQGQQEGNKKATVPGCWTKWSSQFDWLRRAETFDEESTSPEYRLEQDRVKRITYAQLAYTQMTNQLLENLCTELPHLLFTERVAKKLDETKVTTRATSPGSLAMVLRELRHYEVALHQGFVTSPRKLTDGLTLQPAKDGSDPTSRQ